MRTRTNLRIALLEVDSLSPRPQRRVVEASPDPAFVLSSRPAPNRPTPTPTSTMGLRASPGQRHPKLACLLRHPKPSAVSRPREALEKTVPAPRSLTKAMARAGCALAPHDLGMPRPNRLTPRGTWLASFQTDASCIVARRGTGSPHATLVRILSRP